MVDSFTFRNHLCIVTELLSINLYELVKADGFAGFSTNLIRRFTVQILGSLTLLRRHRVVHCDLKPEVRSCGSGDGADEGQNILLKHPAKSAIKVIDFGSSCFEHEKSSSFLRPRAALTRRCSLHVHPVPLLPLSGSHPGHELPHGHRRAPSFRAKARADIERQMWSLGCILAEMFTGYPIFPGENEQEQFSCIMEVLGLPDKYLVDRSSRKKLFFGPSSLSRTEQVLMGR